MKIGIRARARARACLSQEGVPVFTVGSPYSREYGDPGCPYLRGVYIFMTPVPQSPNIHARSQQSE